MNNMYVIVVTSPSGEKEIFHYFSEEKMRDLSIFTFDEAVKYLSEYACMFPTYTYTIHLLGES